MATRNYVPRVNGEGSIGTEKKHWGAAFFDKVAVKALEVIGGETENDAQPATVGWAKQNFAKLLKSNTVTSQGDFSFAGTRGQTITHNLGHTNYVVNASATSDTGGDLGDVYVSRAANAFTVYNTGGYRGGARYQIMN